MTTTSSFRDLYYQWEANQWEALAIDLPDDVRHDLPDEIVRALRIMRAIDEWSLRSLVPLMDAAPTEEQQVFLSTQLVDEARHHVLLDRLDLAPVEVADALDHVGAQQRPVVDRLERILLEFALERVEEPGLTQALTAMARDERRHERAAALAGADPEDAAAGAERLLDALELPRSIAQRVG